MTETPTPLEKPDRAVLRRLPGFFAIETLEARYLRQSFKPHAHDEYLIGVIDGGVHSVWCRGEQNAVPAGSVVTMRPGDVHHGGAGGAQGWRQRMIYVPEAAMRTLLSDQLDRPVTGTLDFASAFHARPDLARRFVDLHGTLHDAPQTLARDTALEALLGLLLSELTGHEVPSRPSVQGRIADAMGFLDAHLAEDISLEDLCQITGLRRRQTIDSFRRATGLPPHAWHLQRRIARVKALLDQGMAPAMAGAETGFADQSHMGRHFAAITGTTPAAYARG
ncbi:AraC family transcriptional regulator [Gemmobacter serpentinus]|uniref:AraC family transcriptional regulator n=1 Tax=Gemmobacter serpentinus TaxID=2652247 RepID=UPI001CF6128C|nr:AraC family transcriptional regulator [Gemmobacter serpentinus]